MMHGNPYRRYRRQMRRAFRGRHGGYPVLFPIPYESLSLVALAAFSRWAYRNRSAFLPFTITAAAFLAAVNMHDHHTGSAAVIAAVTGFAVAVMALPGRLLRRWPGGAKLGRLLARVWDTCGIGRTIERTYAATVIATAGGWLAAAIAAGPAVKPLPAIAAIATVILGIPWWAHRRRRARVRAWRTIHSWPALAENMGLPGSRITSIVVDAWGWTAKVLLRKGTTAEHAVSQIPAIESGLGLRRGSARVFPDEERADRFTLRVIESDPHAQPIPWPGAFIRSITQLIELGLSEDGQPVRINILRRNVLIGGMTGAGKSVILNIIIAALVMCLDVEIWGVDLKGGMELAPWAKRLRRFATTPAEADQLFRDAVTRLNERAKRKAAEGRKTWEPTATDPAIIIIVDEYAELTDESHDCADSIARRGRAVALNLIAATQRPTQEAMGKHAVRSQMDVRICLRVRERRDADLVLGQGSYLAGWHPHALTQPGAFLVSDPEHTTPQRYRAYLITEEQITQHAARHAHREPADTAPGAAHGTPEPPQDSGHGAASAADQAGPETALWAALSAAGPEGASVAELIAATGMSRSWVYNRLRDHAQAGHVAQTVRGSWRAIRTGPGDGRPPPRPRTRRRDRRRPPRGD